jgi:hypothetical protein
MTEQKISIDEQTVRQIMDYYKVGNHDVFAKYVRSLGIEHTDTA